LSKPIGIDKITLFLPVPELTVEPHFAASIHNTQNAATHDLKSHQQLFWNGERFVTGQKATFNTDDYQVTIAPDRGGGAPNCIVQWSARAFAGSNEVPMDRDAVQHAARHVRDELREAGLHFPMEKARLVRVDLAKNVEMSHPVASYTPVFGALQGRKSMNKLDWGGSGILMGNTQRQVALYDKGLEMHSKGMPLDECPVNTLRPECRLMKGRVVSAALGVETLEDLRRGWEKIPGAYAHSMEQDVFRAKMESKIGAALDFYQEARFIMDGEFLRKWQAFKSDATPMMLVERFGLEAAKQFVAFELVDDPDSTVGKRQTRRMHAELEQAAFAMKLSDVSLDRSPLQELYEELKRAVLSR
jgi:hypothetical protein